MVMENIFLKMAKYFKVIGIKENKMEKENLYYKME